MNQQAIRDLVRFALAAAARLDRRVDLGPIHLLKLLFLADWAFAQRHEGNTFTGIPWRFHNFGPYCYEAVAEVESIANSTGAQDRSFLGSKSGREVKRWSVERDGFNDDLYYELDRSLPPEVSRAIQQTVQSQGSATYPLLHQVYSSLPMRCSAPGEIINFTAAVRELLGDQDSTRQEDSGPEIPVVDLRKPDPSLSSTQRKKHDRAFCQLRERMDKALLVADESDGLVFFEPTEDEVFDQGMSWLDPQGDSRLSFAANFQIHPSVWHSPARRSIP